MALSQKARKPKSQKVKNIDQEKRKILNIDIN